MPLSAEQAQPIVPGVAPLTRREIMALLPQVPGWSFENGKLRRRFSFDSVGEAVAFIGQVIALGAEGADHYPDICITRYRHVDIFWYTHASGGLTRTDFVLAAKLSEMNGRRTLF
jgi:4a-hydroxytetrahydrobiopterin dehydratase